MVKILILIGGGKGPLKPFLSAGKKLGHQVKGASFSRLEFFTPKDRGLKVDGQDLADFNLIYLRVVGRRFEDAALVVQYAREKGISLVDSIFEKQEFIRLPLAKSQESRLFIEAGLPLPPTYFGTLKMIVQKGPDLLGFPFVIKGTTGRQGHAVWSPRNRKELNLLVEELMPEEKNGGRFIAQKFIKAGQRHRHLVIGEKVVGVITRPTRWRKRFLGEGALPGEKRAILPIPQKEAEIALKAAKALGIDVAGVDIIKEDQTGQPFVLEVNSAPRWASIKKDTGVKVEEEIIKFLAQKAAEKKS